MAAVTKSIRISTRVSSLSAEMSTPGASECSHPGYQQRQQEQRRQGVLRRGQADSFADLGRLRHQRRPAPLKNRRRSPSARSVWKAAGRSGANQ